MQPSGLRFSPKPGPGEGGKTGGMPQENGNFLHDGGGLQVILSPEGRVVTVMTR